MAELHAVRHKWLRRLLASAFSAGLMLTAGHPSYYAASQFAHGRLVRIDPIPTMDGEVCLIPAAVQRAERAAVSCRGNGQACPWGADTTILAGDPGRKIQDKYPAFAAIGVDPQRNEVIVTDENLFQVLVYDRLENTAANAEASKPKRVLSGDNTLSSSSPASTSTRITATSSRRTTTRSTRWSCSPRAATGTLRRSAPCTPARHLRHRRRREAQRDVPDHPARRHVVVFRKDADKDEAPLRLLQGDDTGLADPHGIAIDPKEDVFFVANYGSRALRRADQEIRTGVPGSGKGRDKANWPLGREFAVPGSGTHAGRRSWSTRCRRRETTGRCASSRGRRHSSTGRPESPSIPNAANCSWPTTWGHRSSSSMPTPAATSRRSAC